MAVTGHRMNCKNVYLQKNTDMNSDTNVNKWMPGPTLPTRLYYAGNQSVKSPFPLNFFLQIPSRVNSLHTISLF